MIASRTSVLFVLSIAGPPLRASTYNKDHLKHHSHWQCLVSIVSWNLANEGVDAKRISRRRNRLRVMLESENQLSKATNNAPGRQCAAEFGSIDKPQDLRPARSIC
jgi:hypothetical protein